VSTSVTLASVPAGVTRPSVSAGVTRPSVSFAGVTRPSVYKCDLGKCASRCDQVECVIYRCDQAECVCRCDKAECVICRCDQAEYIESEALQKLLSSKQVRCLEEGCCFQSTLAEYLLHGHGKAAYSNTHVDFDDLTQPLIRLSSTADSGSQPVLSTSVRSHLLQVTSHPYRYQCIRNLIDRF